MVIDYTDTTGGRRSIEKNVSIQFRPDAASQTSANAGASSQTSFFSSWIFYIILIAIAGAGWYFRKKIIAVFSKSKK